MTRQRLSGLAGIALAALALTLAFATPALAKNGQHGLITTFGPEGPHAKSSVGFEHAAALAVDQSSGDVYLVEKGPGEGEGSGTVEKFDAAGEKIDFTGSGVGISGNKLTGFSFNPSNAVTELAVDNDPLNSSYHDLYVVNNGIVLEHNGHYGSPNGTNAIRAFQESGEPADFTAGSGAGTNEISGPGEFCGVAVDAYGDVYVAGNGKIEIYAENGAFVTSFSAPHACQLAVNSHGAIYTVAERKVIEFVPSPEGPVTLATTYTEVPEPLDEPYDLVSKPNGPCDDQPYETHPQAIAVEPATDDLYVHQITQQGESSIERTKCEEKHEHYEPAPSFGYIVQFDGSGHVIGSPFGLNGEGALAKSEGVAVDGASGDVYASNANSGSQSDIFGPIEYLKPQIAAEAVSEIGATGATLSASINPEGEPTTYRVEYAPSGEAGCFTNESCPGTAPASIGEGEVAVPIEVRLSGLRPGTHYVVRVVATAQGLGSNAGQVVPFTTLLVAAPTSSELPDGRVYEGVSLPVSADGEVFPPETGHEPPGYRQTFSTNSIRAAADGEAVAYAGEVQAPSGGGSGGRGRGYGDTFLARRGADGWEPVDITPSVEGAFQVYGGFTADLSQAFLRLVNPIAQTPEALLAHCAVLYSYANAEYYPQFTSAFEPGCIGEAKWAAASTDGSVVAFEAEDALTPEAVAGDPGAPGSSKQEVETTENLYVSSGGHVQQVNIGVEGEAEAPPDAIFGGPAAETVEKGGEGGIEVQGHINNAQPEGDLAGAVAANGSRAFWSSLEAEKGDDRRVKALYARVNPAKRQSPVSASGECTRPADACTIELDATQGAAPGPNGGGEFRGASADGSRALFMDCHHLTEDSTAVTTGAGCSDSVNGPCRFATCGSGGHEYSYTFTGDDLYEYDFDRPVGQRLTDLTIDHNGGDPLGANVQGVLGSSEDGSHLYFVADGDLAAGAVAGQPNLYLWHEGEPIKFIATLAPGDERDWRAGLAERSAEVTPDGQAVVFQSTRALTGFDNDGPRCVVTRSTVGVTYTAGACSELYVYDAGSSGAGSLTCASCSPVGALPSEDGGYLPNWDESPAYQQRVISASGGRVFFDSPEALVEPAVNGLESVYEWEALGEGTCTAQAASSVTGGCTYLLSGVSNEPATFLDADVTGDNVFFTTRAQLIPEDKTQLVQVYDARVGGGFPHPSTACTGTGCQGVPPAPPTFATPSSVTFNGTGNFPGGVGTNPPTVVKPKPKTVKCAKGKKLKHGKCTKIKTKKKNSKAKKSAHTNRRTGR
jgi:hypothetical protein